MDMQGTRPFHLHYHVPDVEYAEQVLTDIGLPLRARFGTVDGEMVAVEAGEQSPDGFRFRLQDAQRGYANVTLTSGKEVQFDHFGVVTSSFDEVVQRAMEADWTVQGVDEPRTFLVTPWSFRIEIHPDDGRIANGLGSWEESRFEDIVLAVPAPREVRQELRKIVGVTRVTVRKREGRPHVPQATLDGNAFAGETTLQSASLATGSQREQ